MRLAKSLTNRDMQITFAFLNTLWKSEKGRMRKEHMNIKKEGKQIRHIGQRFGRKHVIFHAAYCHDWLLYCLWYTAIW